MTKVAAPTVPQADEAPQPSKYRSRWLREAVHRFIGTVSPLAKEISWTAKRTMRRSRSKAKERESPMAADRPRETPGKWRNSFLIMLVLPQGCQVAVWMAEPAGRL